MQYSVENETFIPLNFQQNSIFKRDKRKLNRSPRLGDSAAYINTKQC